MKYFLCVESGDEFFIEAESLEQAREDAAVWNAEVIREISKDELFGSFS